MNRVTSRSIWRKLGESEGWRPLEGRSQRWSFGRVAERENRQQRQQAEGHQKAYKEGRQKRHPCRSVCGVAVGYEQRNEGDHDGCDRDPVPGSLLTKNTHGCLAEYSNSAGRKCGPWFVVLSFDTRSEERSLR